MSCRRIAPRAFLIAVWLAAGVARAQPQGARAGQKQALHAIDQVLRGMVIAAVKGSAYGYLSALDDDAKARLEGHAAPLALKRVAGDFLGEWQRRYGEEFELGLRQTTLPLTIELEDRRNARVTLNSEQGELPFRLVEGVEGWRVQAPPELNRDTLASDIERAAAELAPETFPWPSSREEAYRYVAYKYLRPASRAPGSARELKQLQAEGAMDSTTRSVTSEPGVAGAPGRSGVESRTGVKEQERAEEAVQATGAPAGAMNHGAGR